MLRMLLNIIFQTSSDGCCYQDECNEHENKIFKKTRNGRLIIFNGKLIIMYLCNYVTV